MAPPDKNMIGDEFPLVSLRRLEALLGYTRQELHRLADIAGRFYRPFDIERPREPRQKWRHIDNPVGELKIVQKSIQRNLLSIITFPEMMFGGIRGRSTLKNAAVHVGQPVVVTLDLKNCFPNTTSKQVFRAWREVFGCSPEIASVLTRLTTIHHRVPQGAPTSPLLENLTLLPMYRQIDALAHEMGLNFSFFVDDITLSGVSAPDAISRVAAIVKNNGHALSRSKTCVMPRGYRQVSTGITVNDKPSNGQDRLATIRREIYGLASQGIVGTTDVRRLNGKIHQASYICPSQGAALRRLADRLLVGVEVWDVEQVRGPSGIHPCDSFARHRRSATH